MSQAMTGTYGSRYRRWVKPDDELDSPSDDYDLQELIESDVTLDSWIEPGSGRLKQVNLPLDRYEEICAVTASGDLEPYRTEYEGYMGNWGNTLDRWYHRGAVVIWPRSQTFALRAQANPSFALDTVTSLARGGDLAGARDAADAIAPSWNEAVGRASAKGLFAKAMRAAELLDEPDLATIMLEPFCRELLTPRHAKPLAALVDRYGEPWAEQLVSEWSANRVYAYERQIYESERPSPQAWLPSLPKLCLALRDRGDGGVTAARLLARSSWRWVDDSIAQDLRDSTPSRREHALSELGSAVAAILQGAATAAATDLRDDAVGRLCGDPRLLGLAIAALRATPVAQWVPSGLDTVADHCSAVLEANLASPLGADDDWSIELPTGCECELCEQLRAFLNDATQVTLDWPLAEPHRRHVHSRIDAAELPVDHRTRRVGRPYTLVLTKTSALFERETQRRRRDEQDLAWVKRSRAASVPAG